MKIQPLPVRILVGEHAGKTGIAHDFLCEHYKIRLGRENENLGWTSVHENGVEIIDQLDASA